MKLKHFSLPYGLQVFKSFSDESRVRILYLLYKNDEMCISDLELVLDFTQTKTSRHLTYMKNAGVVTYKKLDQYVFYYLRDEVSDIVSQLFKYMEKDNVLLKDQEDYRILFSNRELAVNRIDTKRWRKK